MNTRLLRGGLQGKERILKSICSACDYILNDAVQMIEEDFSQIQKKCNKL